MTSTTSTSRVRVYLATSLDGFIAGPDDDLSWLGAGDGPPPPDGEALGFDALLAQLGAMIMGRRTWDVVSKMDWWGYGDMPILVPTHRPLQTDRPTVKAVQGDIGALIDQARAVAGGKDIYLDGGQLVRQGVQAGLVDELCLTVVPILLGGGVSLWDGLAKRSDWRFVSHHDYGRMVQLTLVRA